MIEVQCKQRRQEPRQANQLIRPKATKLNSKQRTQTRPNWWKPTRGTPKTPRNIIIYFFQSNTGNDREVTNKPRLIRCRLTVGVCFHWRRDILGIRENVVSPGVCWHKGLCPPWWLWVRSRWKWQGWWACLIRTSTEGRWCWFGFR